MSEKNKNPDKSVDEPMLISTKKLAERLSIGKSLLFQMASDGRLGPRPIRFGKRTLWDVEEVAAWVRLRCPTRDSDEWRKAKEKGKRYAG